LQEIQPLLACLSLREMGLASGILKGGYEAWRRF
jgi:rhodanese-related sulfurtransferase